MLVVDGTDGWVMLGQPTRTSTATHTITTTHSTIRSFAVVYNSFAAFCVDIMEDSFIPRSAPLFDQGKIDGWIVGSLVRWLVRLGGKRDHNEPTCGTTSSLSQRHSVEVPSLGS